jgi:hypothetical protein
MRHYKVQLISIIKYEMELLDLTENWGETVSTNAEEHV